MLSHSWTWPSAIRPGNQARVPIETGIMLTLLTGLFSWGGLAPVLFLQGIDLFVLPSCALYAAFRLPIPHPKDGRFRQELFMALGFMAGFTILRVSLNLAAYGGPLREFPNGPSVESFKILFFGSFFYPFFRCFHYFYAFLARKKALSLQWKMMHNLVLLGSGMAMGFITLGAVVYAFSPTVNTMLAGDLNPYSSLMHRLVLGFVIFFCLGFLVILLLSPFFLLLFLGASFFSTQPIANRLRALARIEEPSGTTKPKLQDGGDEITNLEQRLQSLTRRWSLTQATLQQEQQRLNGLIASHHHLVSAVSHELRTPLTLAKCYLESAQQQPMREAQLSLSYIQQQLEELQALLGDLQLPAGQDCRDPFKINLSRGCLATLLHQVGDHWRDFAWQRHRVTLVMQTCDNPRRVLFDPQRMRQVLVNLLHNALRFTDPGGLVLVRLQEDTSHQTLTISDTGCGMDETMLTTIWQPYTTAGKPGKSQTGLGCSLVKTLVEGMGGQITVDSQLDKGTTFSLRFPHAPVPVIGRVEGGDLNSVKQVR